MAVLFVTDNIGIGCSGWVLRSIVASTSAAISEKGNIEFANWLVSDESPVNLYSDLDVRELTKENQTLFVDCLPEAYTSILAAGPNGWGEPEAWEGFVELFENLILQIEAVSLGNSPPDPANLSGISAYDGKRSGPGWESS